MLQFMFRLFGPKACRISAHRPGIEPTPRVLEITILTAGLQMCPLLFFSCFSILGVSPRLTACSQHPASSRPLSPREQRGRLTGAVCSINFSSDPEMSLNLGSCRACGINDLFWQAAKTSGKGSGITSVTWRPLAQPMTRMFVEDS